MLHYFASTVKLFWNQRSPSTLRTNIPFGLIEATDEVVLILNETMDEARSVFLKTVPVEAEVVIANSWSEK